MHYYYNPEAKYLLIRESEKTENVLYDDNSAAWPLPAIGPRPPYYTNPVYQAYYPVI
ncbi:hypothetical protein SH601_12145 [Gracilibacillus sp. S3-1-1]|uniref:Uncharacterized protein n=1 Tax=Gracilibacillus pellucidus TaxID=3095368 RepID=A0ACC6M763_9BACI|nr:hypothetical protein [Gracilibacillus sp. S3-1-1]MDX8046733.1 hypothetical protein [Gracilibacillus sp. S3-1-1]